MINLLEHLLTLNDIISFSNLTKNAFESGKRK